MENRKRKIKTILFLILVPLTIYCQYVKVEVKKQKLTVHTDSIKISLSKKYISPTLIDEENTLIILPDTLPDGTWVAYFKYDTSKIACSYVYKNKIRNGIAEIFWKNGKIKEIVTYKDGKREGRNLEYYKTGLVKDETFYIKGQQHGLWIRYYENGSYQLIANYNLGTELNPSLYWDEKGNQVKSINDTHKQFFNFK